MDYTPLKPFATAVRTRLLTAVDQQLTMVVAADSWARRESPAAVAALEQAIASQTRAVVIESIAYTWFNRFTALRYFDLQGWNQPAVVSPAATGLQPEVLDLAKQDIYPEALSPAQRTTLVDLLSGRITSANRDEQVYRVLFFDACHTLHRSLPFLFEPIADYTELLLPNDLLTSQSILADIRTALTPDLCTSVEVLGWIYQYYISDRKDAVMAAKAAVKTSDIPAVTQLFTPNWIVRYLVENALGRLWLRSHPNSTLRDHMQYYVPDDAQSPAPATLTVQSPEEIRLIDPACGSGHMLVYAFDLLVKIYEEQGYAQRDIPRLILTHNLHGIDLCPRAAQLAALALVIKARSLDPSFLRANRAVAPHITLLADLTIPTSTLTRWGTMAGLPKASVERLVQLGEQFAQASTLGSLITPDLSEAVIAKLRASLPDDPNCATLLAHIEVLAPRYHVVVANPPYHGRKHMNKELRKFADNNFENAKFDTFAMFMMRSWSLSLKNGFSALVTMESWMFLGSYENLRSEILNKCNVQSMLHMPYLGKGGTSMGINFGTVAYILTTTENTKHLGKYFALRYWESDKDGVPLKFPIINDQHALVSAEDFRKIPGQPFAYAISKRHRELFAGKSLEEAAAACSGLQTGDNERFLRQWHEVSFALLNFELRRFTNIPEITSYWIPHKKGGAKRKWYGNDELIINWKNDGEDVKKHPSFLMRNEIRMFERGVTWSHSSNGGFSARIKETFSTFNVEGPTLFYHDVEVSLGYLNSKVTEVSLYLLAPTQHFLVGVIRKLPMIGWECLVTQAGITSNNCINFSKSDWDAFETSWDFTTLPLLRTAYPQPLLAERYAALQQDWQAQVSQMHALEVENNRIFIDAYGLQDELSPDVPMAEITLTCNPVYRYGDRPTHELAALQRADTMRELLSYAVGCMMGRYSLDKPGLILANAGDGMAQYLQAVGLPTEQLRFAPDDDGVIPLMEEEWFPDDVVNRTRVFLDKAFGTASVAANQHSIEQALGKSLRAYYQSEFYKNHLQVYKKRPIYWLFRSKKGTFGCLLAMHRYQSDTLSIVLNKYLRQTISIVEREKQRAEQGLTNPLSTTRERSDYTRQVSTRTAQIAELREYERTLLALASQQISIDLDDGVKVNYLRFAEVLEKIPGLEAAAEE